ncbi:hypothetical protein [Sporisorium scitamineum]|uniref:Uncharacterized protein n=1 Tax=Sporisorium scitamineum TaxID=49012 RepID=A0A0F7RUY0_9BASI|nr:hypothetical protein [Sporisorium scitamineum]
MICTCSLEQLEDSLEGGSELEQGTRVDMWLHSK